MKVSTLLVFCLSCCVVSAAVTCPPLCDPPNHVTGCQAYLQFQECKRGLRDVSISVASCGCLWQSHIQLVEPEAKVVFTDAGNQCYKWALQVCRILEKQESVSIVKPMEELLRRVKKLEYAGEAAIEKEIAKSRRRTGVTLPPLRSINEKPIPKPKEVTYIGTMNRENPITKPVEKGVTFIGIHSSSSGASSEWVEVEKEKKKLASSPWMEVKKVNQKLASSPWMEVNTVNQKLAPSPWMEVKKVNKKLAPYPRVDVEKIKQKLALYPRVDVEKNKQKLALYPWVDVEKLKQKHAPSPWTEVEKFKQKLALYPRVDVEKKKQKLALYPWVDVEKLKQKLAPSPWMEVEKFKQKLAPYPWVDVEKLKQKHASSPWTEVEKFKQKLAPYRWVDVEKFKQKHAPSPWTGVEKFKQKLAPYRWVDVQNFKERKNHAPYRWVDVEKFKQKHAPSPWTEVEKFKQKLAPYRWVDVQKFKERKNHALYPWVDVEKMKQKLAPYPWVDVDRERRNHALIPWVDVKALYPWVDVEKIKQKLASYPWVDVDREKKNFASTPWVMVMREKVNNPPTDTSTQTSETEKKQQIQIITIFLHWFNARMQDDEFKMIVFLVVLLMNILVVIAMVICSNSRAKKKTKEPKQCGDLDLHTFRPKKSDETRKSFFEKLKWHPAQKQNPCLPQNPGMPQNTGMPSIPYLHIEKGYVDQLMMEPHNQNPRNQYSQTSSTFLPVMRPETIQPRDSIQKHHEALDDFLLDNTYELLDNTYEKPVSMAPSRPPSGWEAGSRRNTMQELNSRAYSYEKESEDDSSPTKYFSRNTEEPRTVSFALPQGTYLTMQDRVDSSQPSQTENERTSLGGAQ